MANDAGTSDRILSRLSETRIRPLRLCYTVKLASTTPGPSSALCARRCYNSPCICTAIGELFQLRKPIFMLTVCYFSSIQASRRGNHAQPLIVRLMLHKNKASPPSIMPGRVAPPPILNYACKAAKFAVLPSSFRDDSLRNG
jgi:hypothetical protein